MYTSYLEQQLITWMFIGISETISTLAILSWKPRVDSQKLDICSSPDSFSDRVKKIKM